MRGLTLVISAAALVQPAFGWDCQGHRAITLLGLDGFAQATSDMPSWLQSDESRLMAASNACEPDRYRSVRAPAYLSHENNPDHYIDIEKLPQFGLTLETVPPLRYEYLRVMAIAKHEHPDEVAPYNELMDPTRSMEWPGFGPHAVMEHHCKLISAFKTYRALERLNDPARAPQMAAAKANILFEIGSLSHFVGDLAQPLHTTEHHHGWVGPNPDGFTTDRKIHAFIDGEILVIHQLDYDTLKTDAAPIRKIDAADPWTDLLAHIRRSNDHVRDIYAMFKSGDLEKEPGKAMITERLRDGGAMLGAMYASAWKASEPSEDDVKDFVRYDRWEGIKEVKPRAEARPKP